MIGAYLIYLAAMHESFYICVRWYIFVITQKTTICLSRLLGKWEKRNAYHIRWCRVFKAIAVMASDDRQAWGKWENSGGELEGFICKKRKYMGEFSEAINSLPLICKI